MTPFSAKSDALSNQNNVLGLLSMCQHMVMNLVLVESNFLWEMTFPPSYLHNAISTHDAV
jgi:hypothetical protein